MLLIKNGLVVCPHSKLQEELDILIEDKKIVKIQKNINQKTEKIIDAKDCFIFPGFIDTHSHLRDPGFEYKEDLFSGSRAAARGGFTKVFCMANTNPPMDNASVVEFVNRRAREKAVIKILPVGAITKCLKGEFLAEIGEMRDAGVVALSDDGRGLKNTFILRKAMEYANTFGLTVISHSEDEDLSNHGLVNEGYMSTYLGLTPIPKETESSMVIRDILLAQLTNCKLHIAHISCRQSTQFVENAKKQKQKISSEVTAHHLTLTDENLISYNSNFKTNPPLREKEEVENLWYCLKNKIIDNIATDHAPHSLEEKECEFESANFGVIGLETAFSVLYTSLFSELAEKENLYVPKKENKLTLLELVEKFTINPATIFNIKGGKIKENEFADLVIFNPQEKWQVKEKDFLSKSKNSPYIGKTLQGKIKWTICDGKIVYEDQ